MNLWQHVFDTETIFAIENTISELACQIIDSYFWDNIEEGDTVGHAYIEGVEFVRWYLSEQPHIVIGGNSNLRLKKC